MRAAFFVLLLAIVVVAIPEMAISPMEIAHARQDCTTQCKNHNRPEAVSCMRQCWSAFFAQRKVHAKTPKKTTPIIIKNKPHVVSSVKKKPVTAATFQRHRSTTFKNKNTHQKQHQKHQIKAPFSHKSVRSSATTIVGGLFTLLLLLIFV
jgi:hypothetical protein